MASTNDTFVPSQPSPSTAQQYHVPLNVEGSKMYRSGVIHDHWSMNVEQANDQKQMDEAIEIDSDAEAEAELDLDLCPSSFPSQSTGITSPSSAGPSTFATAALPSHLPAPNSMPPPPKPSIPQDISLIMEMISRNEVVGSLPPVDMSAAEKRKLVEARITHKSKGATAGTLTNRETANEENDPTGGASGVEDIDSESSSEFESSSEEDSEDEENEATAKGSSKQPMTAEEHAAFKLKINELIGENDPSNGPAEAEYDSSPILSAVSDGDEDDEDEDCVTGDFYGQGMLDDEEDEDFVKASNEAILSTNETPLPPVQQPPMKELPKGAKVILAGEVISWIKEKKVEAWALAEEKRKSRAEDVIDEFVKEEKVDEIDKEESGSIQKCEAVLVPSSIGENTKVGEIKQEGTTVDTTPAVPEPSPYTTTLKEEEVVIGTGEVPSSPLSAQPAEMEKKKKPETSFSKFTSAGTVIVRAMQSQPTSSIESGWLEEGSVVCWEDGRVMGAVSETFGPLTSPFYQIRLPPPPHPYPSSSSLSPGTRLFFPDDPKFRSFVNMAAVRDPRFKGSDASNIYDEEVGEDEMEWSDDEAEEAAKRRRKQARAVNNNNGGSKGKVKGRARSQSVSSQHSNVTATSAAVHAAHGLPARPHFDYAPEDEIDSSSLYDGGDGDRWEMLSEAGSTVSQSRARPGPYDDLEDVEGRGGGGDGDGGSGNGGGSGFGRGGRGERGGIGRERGKGSVRGRGWRDTDEGRGGGGGRGNGQSHRHAQSQNRGQGQGRHPGPGRNSQQPNQPPPPQQQQQHRQPRAQAPPSQYIYQSHPYPPQQFSNFSPYPQPFGQGSMSEVPFNFSQPLPMGYGRPPPPLPQSNEYSPHQPQTVYSPHQPSFSPYQQCSETQQSYTLAPSQSQGQGQGQGMGMGMGIGVGMGMGQDQPLAQTPAINPRFAAQLQQMGYGWNHTQSQGQGQGQRGAGPDGYSRYSE